MNKKDQNIWDVAGEKGFQDGRDIGIIIGVLVAGVTWLILSI